MKEIKFVPPLLAALFGLVLCGCNLGSVSTDDVADYVSGIEPEQAVSLATNLLTLPEVQNLANAIMADSNLVATITNAWNEVEDQYTIPGEVVTNAPGPVDPAETNAVPVPEPAAAPVLGKKFEVIWIPANFWGSQGEARMLEYIDACAEEGCHIGIEMAGWGDGSNVFVDDKTLNECIRLYKVAVLRCRVRGIFMFNSILNNNSHINKWGNKHPYTFTSVWPKALKLLACVKDLGPANQYIQPCAETQTSDGKQWEQTVRQALPGWDLVYGGEGGHATKPGSGFKFFANHPCDKGTKVPKGCLAVSDCGTIIQQLHAGISGPAHKDTLHKWIEFTKSCGAIAAGDYAFKYVGPADVNKAGWFDDSHFREDIAALAEAAR